MQTSMQPIFFNKAGNILLEKYVCGKPSRKPGDAIFHHGAVVSITPNVNVNTQELPDGNSDWPAAEPVTGRDGTIAVELSFMSPELYAFLMGTKVDELENETMTEIDYEVIVPEDTYSIELPREPVKGSILIVDYKGTHFEIVDGDTADPLTQGQVKVDTTDANKLIFSDVDAGKAVYITYDWIALTAKSFGFPKSGTPYAFRATISGEAMGDDEATMYDTNIIVDRTKAIGAINPPPLSKTPAPQTITLKVLKPRGNKAVDFKFAPKEGSC